jgi:hypothetical protein
MYAQKKAAENTIRKTILPLWSMFIGEEIDMRL